MLGAYTVTLRVVSSTCCALSGHQGHTRAEVTLVFLASTQGTVYTAPGVQEVLSPMFVN